MGYVEHEIFNKFFNLTRDSIDAIINSNTILQNTVETQSQKIKNLEDQISNIYELIGDMNHILEKIN